MLEESTLNRGQRNGSVLLNTWKNDHRFESSLMWAHAGFEGERGTSLSEGKKMEWR